MGDWGAKALEEIANEDIIRACVHDFENDKDVYMTWQDAKPYVGGCQKAIIVAWTNNYVIMVSQNATTQRETHVFKALRNPRVENLEFT